MIVLTDGPDTCNPESDTYQHCFDYSAVGTGPQAQSPCTNSSSYAQAKAAVQAYLDSGKQDVHISFVHFQSPGYHAQDPRMQEIACLTGGHYLFINTNQIASNTGTRKDAIVGAIEKIRYTLGGYWSLVSDIPVLTDDVASKPGRGFAIQGVMGMGTTPFLHTEQAVTLAVGGGDNVDRRLPFMKPCTSDDQCEGGGADECGMRCDPESGLCAAPKAGSSCGGDGVCCAGTCAAGQTVCSDPADSLSCP